MNKKFKASILLLCQISCEKSSEPLSSKYLAEKTSLTTRYAEQVLQNLVRNNILKGVRGASGGYLLARERRKIYLDEIFRISLAEGKEFKGHNDDISIIFNKIDVQLSSAINDKLEKINLEQIYKNYSQNRLLKEDESKQDFVI